jgi:hypothetical protein
MCRKDIERTYGFKPAVFSRLVTKGLMPARLTWSAYDGAYIRLEQSKGGRKAQEEWPQGKGRP